MANRRLSRAALLLNKWLSRVYAPAIAQRVIEVDAPRRTQLLRHLVQSEGWSRVLVFVATKHAAEIVADKLRKAGIEVEPFHGELSQGKRSQVLRDFKRKILQVVVATNVAARGIDIARMPVVVNFDLPRSAVDYTHRIGRTGRAGESGVTISFVSVGTAAHFRFIEKRQRLNVAREQVAGVAPVQIEDSVDTPSSNGGIKGKRPSKKDRLRAAAVRGQAQLRLMLDLLHCERQRLQRVAWRFAGHAWSQSRRKTARRLRGPACQSIP